MRICLSAPIRYLLGFAASFLLTTVCLATQEDLNREVDRLLVELTDGTTPINELIDKKIKWSGISDARLFDAMEAELLANYRTKTDFDDIQRNSWLVQALAFSGQAKYRATIETVMKGAKTMKLRQHAESSLRVQPDFARWSPVIGAGVANVPADRIEKQRIINMMSAADSQLVRAGASFVFTRYVQDPEMIELTRQQLIARYKTASLDPHSAQAVAWLCKVLGETDNKEFIPLLTEVKANANHATVERWAGLSISKLKNDNASGQRTGQDHFR